MDVLFAIYDCALGISLVTFYSGARLHRFDLGVCVTENFFVPELRLQIKSGKEVLFASSDRHILNANGYLRSYAAPEHA